MALIVFLQIVCVWGGVYTYDPELALLTMVVFSYFSLSFLITSGMRTTSSTDYDILFPRLAVGFRVVLIPLRSSLVLSDTSSSASHI